jgi:MFS family permease
VNQTTAHVELSDRERSLTMLGILTAMFLAALDQSIVTPAMPTIGGELGDAQYLPWIVTAYLLTATGRSTARSPTSMDGGRCCTRRSGSSSSDRLGRRLLRTCSCS